MGTMVKSEWNERQQLLEIIYSGEVDTTQMRENFEEMSKIVNLPLHIKAIIYVRTSNYTFKEENKKLVRDYISNILKYYGSISVAIVIEHIKDFDTGIGMLYTLKMDKYQYKVFNSAFAALLWLNSTK